MRIAIDARKVTDFGIGTYLRNLIRHVLEFDNNEYVLLGHRKDEALLRSLHSNARIAFISAANYSFSEHLSIPWQLYRIGADLLHSPHYVVPLYTSCRTIVTVHDVIHLLFPQHLPSRIAKHYAHFMIQRALSRSKLVVTVSNASKRDLLQLFEIEPEKILVIHNGIDAAMTRDVPNVELMRIRERFQLSGRTVLFVGNIKPHKNVERVISAFAKVRENLEFGDLNLVVVGDDITRYPSLRRAVERHQVRANVRFFGFVPETTLVALYRAADVFVFPSLYEGFGLPPLEAMANGTPVVTSSISSLPEVVGNAALTVDPYNVDEIALAIQRILSDSECSARLIAAGLERVQHFSWKNAAKQLDQAYRRALEQV